MRAECQTLLDNIKAAAARNAEKEQSIEVLKQELANLKELKRAAKKGGDIAKMEKMNDQLRSELEQLEHFNQFLAHECQIKDSVIDRQKATLRNEKVKTEATEKSLFGIRNKNIMNRPSTLYEIFLVEKFCFKKSTQETLPQNEPVDAP